MLLLGHTRQVRSQNLFPLCWCIHPILVQWERKHMAGHVAWMLQSCEAIGSHVTVLANEIYKTP